MLQLLAAHLCLRVQGSFPRVMYVVSAALAKPPSKPHLQQHDTLSSEPCTQLLKMATHQSLITLQAWFVNHPREPCWLLTGYSG